MQSKSKRKAERTGEERYDAIAFTRISTLPARISNANVHANAGGEAPPSAHSLVIGARAPRVTSRDTMSKLQRRYIALQNCR